MGEIVDADAGHDRAFAARACRGPEIKGNGRAGHEMSALGHLRTFNTELLISGSFDTLTSLAGAKAAAAKLSNATIIGIPGIGHAVSPWSPCAQTVIVSFLTDPAAPATHPASAR